MGKVSQRWDSFEGFKWVREWVLLTKCPSPSGCGTPIFVVKERYRNHADLFVANGPEAGLPMSQSALGKVKERHKLK